MNNVRVSKERLLTELSTNREKHLERYLEVEAAYRKKIVEECYDKIVKAENGEKFDRHFEAVKPTDHTEDYDRAIMMLNYSVEDTVELTSYEFDNYVLDRWDWSGAFGETYAAYTA